MAGYHPWLLDDDGETRFLCSFLVCHVPEDGQYGGGGGCGTHDGEEDMIFWNDDRGKWIREGREDGA